MDEINKVIKLIEAKQYEKAMKEKDNLRTSEYDYFIDGYLLLKQNKIKEARKNIKNFINKKKFERNGYILLARIYFLLNKPKKIEKIDKTFQGVFGVQSNKIKDYLANAYYNQEQYEKAKEIYENAIKVENNPKIKTILEKHYIKALAMSGDREKALKEINGMINNSEDPSLFEIRALVYSENFEYEKALKEIERAIKGAPDNLAYRVYQLSYKYYAFDLDSVIKEGEELITYNQLENYYKGIVYFYLFCSYLMKESVDKAEKYLNLYHNTKEGRENSEYFRQMGLYYFIKGENKKKMEMLNKSYELNKNSIPTVKALISIYQADNNFVEAENLRQKYFYDLVNYDKKVMALSKVKEFKTSKSNKPVNTSSFNMSSKSSVEVKDIMIGFNNQPDESGTLSTLKSISFSIKKKSNDKSNEKDKSRSTSSKTDYTSNNSDNNFQLDSKHNSMKKGIFSGVTFSDSCALKTYTEEVQKWDVYDSFNKYLKEEIDKINKNEKKLDKKNFAPLEYEENFSGIKINYIGECNLEDLLEKNKDIPNSIKKDLILFIGECLQDMHEKKIFHGNLKPSNILIKEKYIPNETKKINICMTDYGLYKANINLPGFTRNSVPFLPINPPENPTEEQMIGFDTYSYAMIIYYIITGIKPFYSGKNHSIDSVYEDIKNGVEPDNEYFEKQGFKGIFTFINDCNRNGSDLESVPKLEEIIEEVNNTYS